MSIRDQSAHAYVNRGFHAVFLEQLEASRAKWEPLINALAMVVPSTTDTEEYDWFGDIPGLVEWTKERQFNRLRADSFSLKNKRYANGLAINYDDLKDDKTGRAAIRIRQLADALWPYKKDLLAELINGGFSASTVDPVYDGKAFFAADHVNYEGGTAHANLGSGALSEANVMAAIVILMALKTDGGVHLNLNATHLIYEPSKQWVALDILKQKIQSTGEENTIAAYTGLQGLCLPGLTAGYWAVADLSKPIKPFILQNRDDEDGGFVMQEDPQSDSRFLRNEVKAGATWRGRAGYGFWQTIVGSPGS